MKTINKGNGSGSGDSYQQAAMKSADNFVEIDSRLHDLERSMPRKLRGWAPPAEGFPQIPSPKGSRWSGATRVGSASFVSTVAFAAGIIPLLAGKILAYAASNSTTGILQLYSVSATGALTALGTPYAPPSSRTVISAAAIGPDLVAVICAGNGGADLTRVILSATENGLSQVSQNLNAGLAFSSYNIRGGRTPNTVFMPVGLISGTVGPFPVGAFQVSALPSEAGSRIYAATSRHISTRAPIAHDMLSASTMIALIEQTQLDGLLGVAATLFAGNDKAVQCIDLLPLASGAAGTAISALALSSTRAVLKASPVQGAFVVDIIDGQIHLAAHDVQAAGILSRSWRAVVQQDGRRGLVIEQNADTTPPTMIDIDPATGAITEVGTVPLVFGTSGSAVVYDAVKIGPDRIVVIGRSASVSPACLVEIWDLT